MDTFNVCPIFGLGTLVVIKMFVRPNEKVPNLKNINKST